VGSGRAALACIGWYGVEHTGGPLQIPAFALAMLAWPEAIVLDARRVTPVTMSFYAILAGLLVTTTLLEVSLIALVVQKARGQNDA